MSTVCEKFCSWFCCGVASAAQPARFIRLESEDSEPKFEQSYTGGYAVMGKKEGYQISGVLGNYFQLQLKEKFSQEFQKEFCVHFDSYEGKAFEYGGTLKLACLFEGRFWDERTETHRCRGGELCKLSSLHRCGTVYSRTHSLLDPIST